VKLEGVAVSQTPITPQSTESDASEASDSIGSIDTSKVVRSIVYDNVTKMVAH